MAQGWVKSLWATPHLFNDFRYFRISNSFQPGQEESLQLGIYWAMTSLQNHRIVGVGRDLCGSSSPTLLPKQGHLQQTAQDLVQACPISMKRCCAFPRLTYLLNATTFSLAGLRNADKLLLALQFFVIRITLVTKFLNNDSKAKFELDFYYMSYFHIL